MIWLFGLFALYLLVLVAAILASVKPVRIPAWITPAVLGAPMESIRFASLDGTPLHAFWVPNEQAKTVFVVTHGFYLNRAELTPESWLLWKEGAAVLLLDARCHGRSGGKITTIGWKERLDVRAAIREARQRMPGAKIVLYGSSMGAAASALAAGEEPVDGLILDSAYSRLSDAVVGWWRFVGGPVLQTVLWPTVLLAWIVTRVNPFRVDVAKAISQAGPIPILFFHGEKDRVATPAEAIRNHSAATGETQLMWFPGRDHSEGRWIDAELYHKTLKEFCFARGWIEFPRM